MRKSSIFKSLIFDIPVIEMGDRFYHGFVNIQNKLPETIKKACELEGVVFTISELTSKVTLGNVSAELNNNIKHYLEKRLI